MGMGSSSMSLSWDIGSVRERQHIGLCCPRGRSIHAFWNGFASLSGAVGGIHAIMGVETFAAFTRNSTCPRQLNMLKRN